CGWGGGRLWVPEVVIVSSEGWCEAVVTARRAGLDALVARVRRLLALVRPIDPAPPICGDRMVTDPADQDAWRSRVRVLVDAMRSPGAPFEKVVLARAQAVEAPAGRVFDPLGTAWHLRAQQPGCTAFAWIADDGSAFVGATPELLCRFDGHHLETTALAGTAPRGRTPTEDAALARALVAEAKERSEHSLVVDAIRDALCEMGADVSLSETPRVRRLGDVQHLETPMSATLPVGCDLLEVVERLHPTPAVGGAPRAAALAWLAAHEDLDRGLYAAPIGWLDVRGRGAFHVALRSAFVTPRRAWAYAGAGIVAASEPDAEWCEVNHKLTALRRALTTRQEVT
ncbi:MAG: isochorismate synthase, partial [Myxococcota bacterium]|nr:isochorismate synthase [Myxococcota bacterium]